MADGETCWQPAEGKRDRLEFGPHSKQVDAAYQQSVTGMLEVRPTAARSSDLKKIRNTAL